MLSTVPRAVLSCGMQLSAPPAPAEVIEMIGRTLAAHPRVLRVILIGSRARGDAQIDSDYDVVVELDADPMQAAVLERDLWDMIPRRRGWELNLIGSGRGEIERWANDPGRIEWDVVRQGRVLYAADGDYALRVPPRRVREGPPESLDDWIFRARQDLEVAQIVLERGFWDHAAYHCQQSGEKYLKALLVSRFVRPERTHELSDLRNAIQAIGIPLDAIEEDCRTLTPFGIESHYGPPRASESAARAALRAAERIRDVVLLQFSNVPADSSSLRDSE